MFQKWFQSKCGKSIALILAFVLFNGLVVDFVYGPHAYLNAYAAEKPPKKLPKLLQEVESKYRNSGTVIADFAQTNFNKITSQTTESKGKLFIKRPSKVRWETFSPDPNLLIGDGKMFWYYTPPFDKDEKGQVIEKPASQVQSQLASSLLSGTFLVDQGMNVETKDARTFILTPKREQSGGVARATIQVDPKKKLIHQVILEHLGGNRTDIILTNIQLGKTVNNDLFVFTPPPNTERVEE